MALDPEMTKQWVNSLFMGQVAEDSLSIRALDSEKGYGLVQGLGTTSKVKIFQSNHCLLEYSHPNISIFIRDGSLIFFNLFFTFFCRTGNCPRTYIVSPYKYTTSLSNSNLLGLSYKKQRLLSEIFGTKYHTFLTDQSMSLTTSESYDEASLRHQYYF